MNEQEIRLCARPKITGALARGRESPKAGALLALLSAVYGIQYLNYILPGLLVQPIKYELHLSDTQVGLLTGFAFSMFYVVLGFPLARLADKGDRRHIVIASVILFSVATAACGLVGGFVSLFIARVCVAVGEAGTLPCAVSMLADSFRPSGRRLAMGIHSSGAFLGTAVGILVLGAVSRMVTWRAIFWSVGAVGLILAALLALFAHEPPRQGHAAVARNVAADILVLLRNKPYVLTTLGLGVASLSSSAAINWVPAFLARSYGLAQTRILLFLALAWGLATVGSIALGYVTNRLHHKAGHRSLLGLGFLSLAFPFAFLSGFVTAPLILTCVEILAAFFLMSGIRGPAFATVQDIVPNNLQATATAGMMLSMYAIGVTLGPLTTGVISDALRPFAGPEALRYALSCVMGSSGVGAAVLFGFAAMSLKSHNSPIEAGEQ